MAMNNEAMINEDINKSAAEIALTQENFAEYIYAPQLIVHIPSPSPPTPAACIQVVACGSLGDPIDALERAIAMLQDVLAHRRVAA